MAAAVMLSGLALPSEDAAAAGDVYEIYPTPHVIQYEDGDYIINTNKAVNVVYDQGVDDATKARLEEALALKPDVRFSESDAVVEGAANILVGIEGSGDYVDTYANENITVSETGLFEKLDSYVLDSDDGVITVLGADTDASFYGLTTLYHILNQMDSYTIRNFHIEDWSDVASRGFIEGYYGNPWSTEDRCDLMEWGGYYKLNAYFYAPKDDPKHRAEWDELYTPEEIESLIRPLAEAGNASKCRFVYALHPFPGESDHLRFDENYETDLGTLKAKFKQVIDAGVRQIAILADDFWNPGGENGLRLLKDVTGWLETEVKAEYPDMKTVVPYVPYDYMGNGSSAELQVLKNAPENVQIVMTGGKVWGEVTDNFTSTFTDNVGRGPFMWINWPCTDNSKKHLIMGGYTTFLHPGVDPTKIQGIMLNPMQQSEPSKVAIFGNACYSWNIWENEAEADQAWEDSFKYVDHNSAVETAASDALRELSRHMINQAMDSRVTALQESVELAPKLTAFREKLNNGSVTEEDTDLLIGEFEILQTAADTYEEQAGNTKVRDQIIYWLNCWDDTTDAALAYLNGVKAVINKDTTAILQYNTEGKSAFDRSKTYGFQYVNEIQYAEVGVQHIVPFINALAGYVSRHAETAMNPDAVIRSFITNRQDAPAVGTPDDLFDGNDETQVSYRNPNSISEGDYIGVLYNRVIDIDYIRFYLDDGKDHFDQAALEYTMDGRVWERIELRNMTNSFAGVKNQYQEVLAEEENLPENFQAMGIRLIATVDNAEDAWFTVSEIQINKEGSEGEAEQERYTGTVTYENMSVQAGQESNYFDGNNQTDVQLAKAPYEGTDRDTVPANAALTITFDEPKTVGAFRLVQGITAANDVFSNAVLQYQVSGSDAWTDAGAVGNSSDQTIRLENAANVTAMRIKNNAASSGWVRISEIEILPPEEGGAGPIEYNVIKTDRWAVSGGEPETNLYDGDDNTYVWYDPDGADNSTGDDFMVNDYLGYDFGRELELKSAHIVIGAGDADKIVRYAVETSADNKSWTPVSEEYSDYTGVDSGKDTLDIDLTGITARYIRIRNLEQRGKWGKFSEFTVQQAVPQIGSAENLYTNVETDMLSYAEEGKVSLTSGSAVLNDDDYIGVDLGNIKAVTDVSTSDLPENTKLQVSMNGIEWTDYDADSVPVDARYIRVLSESADTAVTLSQFDVSFDFIGDKSVESNFANSAPAQDMRNNGGAGNVFDGDLATFGMITGSQDQGKYITFDLGQVIDFTSIRYYIVETQLNYLRDARFEVSADGDQWTEVLRVGTTVVNNTFDSTTAKDAAYLTHDSNNPGYMYAEATGLNVSGRYIRVTPMSSYSHRWAAFSEIQINGGAYISAEDERDIISEAVEEKNMIPSNMLDGDYSTSYKSSAEQSSFTYRISDPQDVTAIRLVQVGEISDAVVTAEYIGNEGSEKLGTLNQAINEFIIPDGKTLKSITVSWESAVPEIAEITTSKGTAEEGDKTELAEALDNLPDISAWTADSVRVYEKALAVAQEVHENENASQTIVDSALASLNAAISNHAEKASDTEELQAIVDSKAGNENHVYTNVSYSAYENAVNNLAEALKAADNLSQERADLLKANVQAAEEGLVYSIRNRELAELAVDTYDTVAEGNYTAASYRALTEAKTAIDSMAAEDKAAETSGGARIDPQKFIEAKTAYDTALAGLVDVSGLKAAISEYESLTANKDAYTSESWTAYENAVNAGKELLAAGTQEQVDSALENITQNAPEMKPDITFDEAVEAAESILNAEGSAEKYTSDSYQALADIVAEAKANGGDSYIQEIQEALDGLVSVEALKAQITAAQQADPDKFTASSYRVLSDLLAQTAPLLKSGSEETVASMAQAIENAIRTLDPRAAGVEEYLAGITLKPENGYTADSYKAYKEAYEALANADPAELSAEEFAQLKEAFEKAELALRVLPADKPAAGNRAETAVDTGDGLNVAPIIFVLILCAAVISAVVTGKKKRK